MESMFNTLSCSMLAAGDWQGYLQTIWSGIQIFLGFSVIILVHEIGHFAVAKWAGVRVERFAVGFFREVVGFTRGETRYSFNLLPLGGYVKMLGQEDFEVDTTGELQVKQDPRSFTNKPVGHRMAIVSAGVIMNLLFAALLFMIVFLIGMPVPVPRLGTVFPDSPAAMAGLMSGDTVLKIDGEQINDFKELTMAVLLAEPGKPLEFVVDRNGEVKHVQVEPKPDPRQGGLFQIGVSSAQSADLLVVGPDYDLANPSHPRPGDKVVEINGEQVTDANAWNKMTILFTNPLGVRTVVVDRPTDPMSEDSPTERVEVQLVPRLALRRADLSKHRPHLLGLAPLMRVSEVTPDSRADYARLEVGDIILEWNGIKNPSATQINKAVIESAKIDPATPERDIPVRVRRARDNKLAQLVVRPKVKIMPLTGKRSRPTIGARFQMFADDTLRIAEIVPDVEGKPTPASVAGIVADAIITKVNGHEVHRWIELAEQFRANAGSSVTLTYDHDGQSGLTCTFQVPSTVRTKLDLGPASVIVAVAGEESTDVTIKGTSDDTSDTETGSRTVPVTVGHPLGLRTILNKHVGETVEITYRIDALADAQTAELAITSDMTEPWVGILIYKIDLTPGGEMKLLRKTNPIAAVRIGVKKTYYFVMQVYQTFHRMIFSRSLGIENIQGPVGILKLGGRVAEAGFVQLFFFLGMLSANLAVLNFLPLPIVDGGLMVFLIIEKIKGSPISIRVQVATQVIGLVLIGSFFVYVTVQDFMR